MTEVCCNAGRILVVDDDVAIRQLFSVIIRTSFSEVTVDTASNGADAVDEFTKGHHQLIIMDLKMPVMDGVAAFMKIEEVCSEKGWAMPAVLFCTGFSPPAALTDILRDGSKHSLIHKPITAQLLVSEITRGLSA